jgi:hypothetical protein
MSTKKPYVKPTVRDATPEEIALVRSLLGDFSSDPALVPPLAPSSPARPLLKDAE